MSARDFTILDEGRAVVAPGVKAEAGRVRLGPGTVHTALGWEVTAEGLCREGLCVPVRPGVELETAEGVDLAALAGALGRPLAFDVDERAAYLGAAAGDRRRTLASLEAPDFGLPDLSGRIHRLSEHRGKKVLLVAYASW